MSTPRKKQRRPRSPAERTSGKLKQQYLALPEHIRALASRPGYRKCACGARFYSPDVDRLRICPKCKQKSGSALREISVQAMGLEEADLE